MTSVAELLAQAADLPVDNPRLEAELLLSHCLEKPRSYLYAWPESPVPAAVEDNCRALFQRRRAGEPLAYLTGGREFWSLPLTVNESTLIPRPETETLVEWALALELPTDARVADLGTGSGAIALALASERPGWQISAVDASEAALVVARDNGERLQLRNVDYLCSDWGEALPRGSFHALFSNPPYVATGDPHLQRGDLRFEPASALVAGEDGLDAIRAIIDQSSALLRPAGWLLLEHGFDQAHAVRELLRAHGFAAVESHRDLAGVERVTGGCRYAQ